jgi:N-acetylglucosaminyl-diphospho-decaprenol L-rhamnosyltransferase
MASSIDIIIVNWNAGPQLLECLKSIAAADRTSIQVQRVVVVDNASSDHSLPTTDIAGLPVTIIQNKENRGFARACNQGARGSAADYLLFLNPDTSLTAGSLMQPIGFMERPENHRIGIVGIQLLDSAGRIAPTCARFPTPGRFFSMMLGLDRALPSLFPSHFMLEWDHRQSREVDQVMGAFFLIRRCLYDAVDGFDERFFVYFEEVDLSLRARAAGWRTFYLSTVHAYHHGSEQVRKRMQPTRLFYSLRSRILYAYKHFNIGAATVVAVGTLFIEPMSRLMISIVRRSPSQLAETVKAYALLWRAVPRRLRAADPPGRA